MNMKNIAIASSSVLFIVVSIFSATATVHVHEHFLECLADEFPNTTTFSGIVHTATSSSFKSILHSSIQNPRFESDSTPKPLLILTPDHESQIPPVVLCAKKTGIQIRTRSGGHDLEGLSYVSQVPFVILDMFNLNEITVDADRRTVWVQSGATVGSLYYRIYEKSSTLAFAAGICPSVGVGGHISGGGFGTMMRRYGIAADHVVDARIVSADGAILERESMGEDLFWAIRGGGGASFGVILAWKLALVEVPEKVTVFTIHKTMDQNTTRLIHKWQSVAHQLDEDLFIRAVVRKNFPPGIHGSNSRIDAYFYAFFLGGTDTLLSLMQESFPELGLTRDKCVEMKWIESVLHFAMIPMDQPLEVLLQRIKPPLPRFKVKSDYVQEPISENGLEGIWKLLEETEMAEIGMIPYGGIMNQIPESSLPFPHRAGNLYLLEYIAFWEEENTDKYMNWSRKLYNYMTPYVSSSPRAAYFNYRDLDLGAQESNAWGKMYFKNNFDRLVEVKSQVDSANFFRDEQSIPPLIHQNTPSDDVISCS